MAGNQIFLLDPATPVASEGFFHEAHSFPEYESAQRDACP
jgi:hypothetical protein